MLIIVATRINIVWVKIDAIARRRQNALFFALKEGVPSGKQDGLHLEEFENLGGYVLLVYYEAEGVLIKPFVGHNQVSVVTT